MSEKLKIFDENRNTIGIADRDEVHKLGHWHETFHCWFIEKKYDTDYIYFQKRCDEKKDFQSLFDITAAGHIMASETVSDGVREINEELGINVQFEELTFLGIIKECIVTDAIIDREFANVYLYCVKENADFNIQKEEVSGIVKAEFNSFVDLCLGAKNEIFIEGYEVNQFDQRIPFETNVSLHDFVPHPKHYLEMVVKLIAEKIKSKY